MKTIRRPIRRTKQQRIAQFPIVAIGASAGGLEAFIRLLKRLPTDTGMGFVLVQHLDPDHESVLSQLLAKSTTMPVREITNNAAVCADCIHVIPPNTFLTISDGILKLHPRATERGGQRSIDALFESLAYDRQELAIAVVLSGSAADGSIGIESIKAEGGITFAQDQSAKFDSMPRSAIATGCVDFVLSPEGIAAELVRISKHPFLKAAMVGNAAGTPTTPTKRNKGKARTSKAFLTDPLARRNSPISPLLNVDMVRAGHVDHGITRILMDLRNHSGVDFSLYKANTIHRRIARRIVLNRLQHLDAYAKFLSGNIQELDALYGDLLIHVTSFFRNPDAFAVLKRKVFPKLLAVKNADPVRMWVLGCSTGQEVYSLAMAFTEAAKSVSHAPSLQIFATDLNEALLEKARNGLYPRNIDGDVSAERLKTFFVQEDGGYRVNKLLREMCVFARQNVITGPPFSKMDLVSCRNLMIYLEPEVQDKILPMLHYALNPNGVLFLGASESLGASVDLFDVVDKKHKIYARRSGSTATFRQHHPAQSVMSKKLPLIPRAVIGEINFPLELNAQREADRVTIGTYAPPGVLINADLHIIQFRGPTGTYLEPPTGKATFSILKMAKDGLALPLRTAISQAVKTSATVRKSNITMDVDGETRAINLEVIPLKNLKEPCFLVFFEPVPSGKKRQNELNQGQFRRGEEDSPKSKEGAFHRRAKAQARELAETRDYLQAIQEQNESATEELQASNEEMTSANEELQSLNEELETSKEELESTNEELTTVNEEMNQRNSELVRLNNDLNNFHASVSMAIVQLDKQLAILHFTPQAEKLFNLIATDIGRTINGVRHNLDLPDLEQLLSEVVDTAGSREREVRDKEGRWYSLRVRPYITIDKKIDGVVMVLVDIDQLKRLQEAYHRSRDYAEAVVQTVPPLLVLDEQLVVKTINRSFCNKFGAQPSETENRSVFDICGGCDDTPRMRGLFEGVLKTGQPFYDVEVSHSFPTIGPRTLMVSARMVEIDSTKNILVCIDDISERKQAAESLIGANRAKDEFLATLAHELRNPLAPMRNSLEIMQHTSGNPAMLEDARLRIMRQMNKMVQLVDDLMDISRISRGKVVLRKRRVDLNDVIVDVVETVKATPEAVRRDIAVKLPDEPIYMDADPLRLNQIVGNLLGNACKYTNPGGKISVIVERDEADAVVRIKDTGIGIAKEMLPRIFDMFIQIDHSLERTHGGLGLGLSIVRSLVQMHAGSVEAHSSGLNKGSEFIVRIPIVESARSASSTSLSAVELPEPTVVFKKRKILVADDNMDSAESLALLLTLEGHEVRTAFDGLDAIATAEQFHPDVALLDIGMPRVNGYDAAREIRKTAWGKNIVLVALTGWGQEHDKRNAIDAGFNLHLVKPAEITDLRRAVATAIVPR